MGGLPERSNFHGSLHTDLSKEQVAELFRPLPAKVRKCAWDEFEVICPWAELIVEAGSPILLHGAVADVLTSAERLMGLLREAGVRYSVECFGEAGELLAEFRWPA